MTWRRYLWHTVRTRLVATLFVLLDRPPRNGGVELAHADDRATIDEWGHADLGVETVALQALMEQHRANPDHEQIAEDLGKARRVVEVLWLKRNRADGRR